MTLIVAIDGPAGVGKTTTSKKVAAALGLPHIDTGAMYRAVALKALRRKVPFDDAAHLEDLAASSAIEFRRERGGARVLLDGEDVSDAIRTPEISMGASHISAISGVRRVLVRLQQEFGRREGGVLEGRDIGTKVFPETPHKFFLTARPEIRGQRRLDDLTSSNATATIDDVLREMSQRDEQDSTRTDSPMTWDDSYTVIDTSELTIDEVVDAIVGLVRSHPPTTP